MEQVLDISRLIDERRPNKTNALVGAICFFSIFADGYDNSVMGFVGPYLIKAWGIGNFAALGPIFSATLPGLVIGSIIFGYIGDHFGRRVACIGASLTVGLFTFACLMASSITELVTLRFFAGIGIGGLIPNTIAITAEYAPKRWRSTLIILMYSGVSFGSASIGLVANTLVPHYGWKAFFAVGAAMPLLSALLAYFYLPESIKYLVVTGRDRPQLVRILARIVPLESINANTQFVLRDEPAAKNLSLKQLFAGPLKILTPLLWLLFICDQMVFFFTASWVPTILTEAHFAPSDAASTMSLFGIGGFVGGFAMCRPLDKFGFAPTALLFLLAMPIIGSIGYSTGSEPMVMMLVFLSGFSILGALYGINASSATIYPTAIRSNASGWAHAVAKLGSVTSTMIGGYLLSWKVPVHAIFLLLLIPLGIATFASLVMTYMLTRERVTAPDGIARDVAQQSG